MFANIFLKTLRDLRWSIVWWGLGLGAMIIIVIYEYEEFMADIAQQAEFAKVYQSFGFLVGEYVPIDTLGGFLTMELVSWGGVLLGLWAAVTGVAITRGEEEPGTLDVLMSAPKSRLQLFAQKVAALGVVILATALVIGLMFVVGLLVTGQTLPADGLAATMFNLALSAGFWGAAGLLAGQLIARRRSASVTMGALAVGTYLLNSVAETSPGLSGLRWLMPVHYYSMSKPLVPGRTLDWLGVGVLLIGTVALVALAGWLFVRRDIGMAAAFARTRGRVAEVARRRKESMALLGSLFARSVRDLVMPTLLWGIGLGGYCALMVATATDALAPMYKAMNSQPWFTKIFGELASTEGYLSVGVFFYMPLVLVAFALTQVAGWASDEEEGRTELLLSEPVSRLQVALTRYAAWTLSLAAILAMIVVGTLASAAAANVKLDAGRIVSAVAAMAPVVLAVLAAGMALAMWLPRPSWATPIVGALVVVMFLTNTLSAFFDWPEIVDKLSVFHLYGKPVTEGIVWGNMALLAGAALLFGALSLLGFGRRDIAK